MKCAKTAEIVEMWMPFEVWTRVGTRNHVLGGDPDHPIRGRDKFERHLPANIENIRHKPKLFGRWQQRCGRPVAVSTAATCSD